MLYELATGNNGVASLAWDALRSTLYAATDCINMDRNGYHHGYRPAKIPNSRRYAHTADKPPKPVKEDDMDEDYEDEDGDDYSDDDDWDGDEYWPERAAHKETHFGYAFDSGDHRLSEFRFFRAFSMKLTYSIQSATNSVLMQTLRFFQYMGKLVLAETATGR
jgi:hypothetical protein